MSEICREFQSDVDDRFCYVCGHPESKHHDAEIERLEELAATWERSAAKWEENCDQRDAEIERLTAESKNLKTPLKRRDARTTAAAFKEAAKMARTTEDHGSGLISKSTIVTRLLRKAEEASDP